MATGFVQQWSPTVQLYILKLSWPFKTDCSITTCVPAQACISPEHAQHQLTKQGTCYLRPALLRLMCALTMALLQLQSVAIELLCGGYSLLSSVGQRAYNVTSLVGFSQTPITQEDVVVVSTVCLKNMSGIYLWLRIGLIEHEAMCEGNKLPLNFK